MLSREDFYMIKQMRQQGAYIVDIAAQIGCSERTVRRYLKYPEPPARKTRHKMVKLKPFMDYIDMRLAENVWNSAYSALFDHGLASKSDQRFASIRSTGNLTFSTAF